LDLEFNSIHNQREAAENYIRSQKHLGWQLVTTHYDDGGYSGGTIERPALKKLKEDIALGKIDIVVVYKVDRLSRSLRDFVNLSNFFEQYNVSFVSITQQIDTSNSMGKLTLNMLLSFAQFEREITSERLKDRIKAARKKGFWTGGNPPMGYSCKNKKLVRNKGAEIIQTIFKKVAEGMPVQELVSYLSVNNILTNTGARFIKNYIYRTLHNQLYIGKISHLEKIYNGKHKAIISKELWSQAHQKLKLQTISANKTISKYPALLKGLMFCKYCNCAMTPNYTKKKKLVFRYYTCMNILRYGSKSCHLKRINAIEPEVIAEKEILKILSNPQIAVNFLSKEKVERNKIESIWKKLPIDQKQIITKEIVKNIVIDHFCLQITFNDQETKNFEREFTKIIRTDDETILKQQQENLNKVVRELMLKAINLKQKLDNGLSVRNIAALEGVSKSQIYRLIRMNYLIPEIQEKILSSTFPYKLKLQDFQEKFPIDQKQQLKWFCDLVKLS
jgi:site-specific DNA recombinase